MTKVAILHDVTHSFGRREPVYEEVFSYELTDDLVAPAEAILEAAFQEFNVGEGPLAQEYRGCELRSLSVGDRVRIDDITYECASFGWAVVPTSPDS